MNVHPIERLRQIWTPYKEVLETSADLEPQTELDSVIRDLLHRTIQQKGPVTLDLDQLNVGTLRWELVHHEPIPGFIGKPEISLWVEE